MNRDANDYLMPLQLAEGNLPLGRLIYHATGEIYPDGAGVADALDDLNELSDEGYVHIESRHNPRHKRMEQTVYLTQQGREAGGHVVDAKQYMDFVEREAGMDGAAAGLKEGRALAEEWGWGEDEPDLP